MNLTSIMFWTFLSLTFLDFAESDPPPRPEPLKCRNSLNPQGVQYVRLY